MAEFNGFLSYAGLDNKYEDGAVSAFRERLEAAVRQWTGRRDFQIFQDTKDIQWGEKWRDKLRSALKDTFLLIPIMTPLYFMSEPCREEWELFVQRE